MNINKHNYEAFFLDHHEGNLTPQEVAELLLFVEQHPELKEEFESFENFTLEDFSSFHFADKANLKKEITEQNREEYFIRAVDGALNTAETELLNNYIKQHPQFIAELELFKKTKLIPDTNIVFENKAALRKVAETSDNLLVAAVEGLLTAEESSLLKQQLAVDPELRKDFDLYRLTKLSADTSIVFENKEALKHKAGKVVPLFYYVSAIAAAILLLFGLFFLFSNNHTAEQPMAKNNESHKQAEPVQQNLPAVNAAANQTIAATPVKEVPKKKSSSPAAENLPETRVAVTEKTNDIPPDNSLSIPEPAPQQIDQPTNTVNSNSIAKAENADRSPSKEFLSLGQIATQKIKEKTLDPEVIAMEKKSGRIKKFSGWDALQVIAKGINKITGAKVEAKPTYNEEGEVTAYALGAGGFQISRGK